MSTVIEGLTYKRDVSDDMGLQIQMSSFRKYPYLPIVPFTEEIFFTDPLFLWKFQFSFINFFAFFVFGIWHPHPPRVSNPFYKGGINLDILWNHKSVNELYVPPGPTWALDLLLNHFNVRSVWCTMFSKHFNGMSSSWSGMNISISH